MDIDEFLDRELSDLGIATEKTDKPETAEFPEFQEQYESSPLFENIKADLSKGNLDMAEQAYVQLWHLLLEQKLKWNKELYDQLAVLSRQFSSVLRYAYTEVKKKANHINELISRARASLKEGKKELPFKLYSEMQELNNSIPNIFFEEKKLVQDQIMDFYKELTAATDNDLLKRVSALLQEINILMDKINNAIRTNDMVNAIVNYNKCIELYNQVPEGFLKYKNNIGMRLLDIYKSLSIYNEISTLQKQLASNLPPNIQTEKVFIAHGQEPQKQNDSLLVEQFTKLSEKPAVHSAHSNAAKIKILKSKKELAKKNMEKGFYNEAYKEVLEALRLEPNDAEAKAIQAKIKTLQ